MYHVPEALNILDEGDMDQVATLNRRCWEASNNNDSGTAYDICSAIMTYIEDISGSVFAYN